MECTRTIGILIKHVRKDIMLQQLLLRCSVQNISFSERSLFVLKSLENIREGHV